jgi:hypothetical protein
MPADPSCRDPIAVIAEQVGHFDASALSPAFSQELDRTPSEVRLAALAGAPPPGSREARAIPPPTDPARLLRHLEQIADGRERPGARICAENKGLQRIGIQS